MIELDWKYESSLHTMGCSFEEKIQRQHDNTLSCLDFFHRTTARLGRSYQKLFGSRLTIVERLKLTNYSLLTPT